MRGEDLNQSAMFSYLSPEERVPSDHPWRAIRGMTDRALSQLSTEFARLYSRLDRPSIAPEKLLRALLLEVLFSVRSERLRMEQLDYNLLSPRPRPGRVDVHPGAERVQLDPPEDAGGSGRVSPGRSVSKRAHRAFPRARGGP